jgi:hypothetical protein
MPSISLLQSGVPILVGGAIQPWITDASGAALSEIWIEADDGVGMAPLHRLSERGPQQHGVTDRGFRLDPRTISLVFGLYAQTLSDLYAAEDQLLTWLVPTDSAMSLLYARDNGTNRQIDVHVAGPPLFGRKDRSGFLRKAAVSFIAPDPLWYDPAQVAETFGASGASTGMAIPWLIPWKLGASSINQSRTLTYPGSFQSSPIIRILGPVTSPVIVNQSSPNADKLDFTGTTIAGGSYYVIDCINKTVVDSSGTNQISKLTSDSDLMTFALWHHPIAPGGANTLSITGTGISSATQVYLTYYARYIGI